MERSRRLVVGLGTGRCGTHSLAALLGAQPGTLALHQPAPCLPWHPDYGVYSEVPPLVEDAPDEVEVVALIGWYYLGYADLLRRDFDARFVCLQRDRESTVASISRLTEGIDNWSNRPPSESLTDAYRRLFPQYDVADKATAIGCYYDEYYARAGRLAEEHPEQFRTFATTELNTESGVRSILDFAGYGDTAVVEVGLRLGLLEDYRWTAP